MLTNNIVQHRFVNTAATLQRTWATSSRLVAADNVDLELIIKVNAKLPNIFVAAHFYCFM